MVVAKSCEALSLTHVHKYIIKNHLTKCRGLRNTKRHLGTPLPRQLNFGSETLSNTGYNAHPEPVGFRLTLTSALRDRIELYPTDLGTRHGGMAGFVIPRTSGQ